MKARTARMNDRFKTLELSLGHLVHVENFLQAPLLNASVLITDTAPTLAQMALRLRANRDWEIAGTNAADAGSVPSAAGGVGITTAAAANDQMLVGAHTDASQSAINALQVQTQKLGAFGLTLTTGASVAAVTLFAGLKLTNTPVIATDDDQAMLRYSTADNNTTWQAVVSSAGTDYTYDTGVAVTASTPYRLEVAYRRDQKVEFVINDRIVAIHDTAVRDANLKPFFGLQTLAAAAKSIVAHKAVVAREI